MEADEQLFRQALFNLVLNAIQAAQEGGEIQIVAERRNGEAVLEVRDNGPGVAPENRKEIFKPYFTTQPKGTGLGWRWCNRLFWRTAGKSSAFRTNRRARFSGLRISRS